MTLPSCSSPSGRSRGYGLLMLALFLAACAERSPTPLPDAAFSPAFRRAGETERSGPTAATAWWAAFGDTTLVRLVERAAAANHDIRIAVERAKQAGYGVEVAEARLFPEIGLGASMAETRTGYADPVKRGLPDTRSGRLGLETRWELDLFGGARAAVNGAREESQAALQGVAGAQLLTVSEVARHYFLRQGARERLGLMQTLLDTRQEMENLTRHRWQQGLDSEREVVRAETERRNLSAALPPLRTLMSAGESRLALLLGADPSTPVAELGMAGDLPRELPEVAAGQPPELLERRPDLLAARHRLAAEGERLQEARSHLFPTLFLSALFGRQNLRLNADPELATARFSHVALAFAMPLFTAGALRAGIEAQSSRQRQALLEYEKAIRQAVEEVEVSLAALYDEKARFEALAAAAGSSRRTRQHADALFREGETGRLPQLEARCGELAAELALSESRARRALLSVQLYKALGGGWNALPPPANAAGSPPSVQGVADHE
ncbi:MAG: efflux transporter outer membrane subunit [Magnetococcales bacterium]|nr:efflux transporter outer membrane subunit [Magnetococcales bacterium]